MWSEFTSLLPAWHLLAPFAAAAIALNLTPGADMTYVIARAMSQGRAAGLASAFGITGGSFVHTLAAALGVSALLLASETAFLAVKYFGAAYLAYLAVQMWRSRSVPLPEVESKAANLWGVFSQGVMVNLLNPKVALFILAFIPQFVDPARGSAAVQILILGTLFNFGGTLVNATIALLASGAARRFKASRGWQRVMRMISATLLGALALRLAISGRG